MIETFKATSISIDEQEGQMTLAVFNEDDDYLFFQCPLEQKDWDNGVYVECNKQSHGGFDVVNIITIGAERLNITLKSPLFALPDVNGFDIELDCEPQKIRALAVQLQAAFDGRSAHINSLL